MKLSHLISRCRESKRIYLYGCGKYGKQVFAFLKQEGVDVVAFIQTKVSEDKSFGGKKIIEIDDINDGKDKLIIICAGKNNRVEMLNEIERRNMVDNTISIDGCENEIFRSVDYSRIVPDYVKRKTLVLLFHRVIGKENDPWKLEISPQSFDAYIRMISENFNVVRFEDEWDKIDEPSVAITFDDGYMDNYRYALQTLEKYKVPATIFVSTGNIDTNKEFWWDELARYVSINELKPIRDKLKHMLSKERICVLEQITNQNNAHVDARIDDRALNSEELKKLSQSDVITIGGHTVTHTALSSEPIDLQRWEIEESKRVIEKIIGTKISTFSYPFGQKDTYTDETIAILRSTGFIKAASNFTGVADDKTNRFEIPRVAISQEVVDYGKKGLDELWYIFS